MESGITICPLLLKDMGQGVPETVTLLGAVISSSHLSTATTPRVPFVEFCFRTATSGEIFYIEYMSFLRI